ncbi:fucolectin-1-like [Hyperolius riggenbachi]|uniref:fucolectin-1-like n=1 Tax=Hyperolius riggenbachi TaxID=752182 RepID=UPI0035A34BA8
MLTYIDNLREEMSRLKTGASNLTVQLERNKQDTSENVALNGVASQSSIFTRASTANKAIDGNLDPEFSSGSCAHTDDDVSPWWRVDLLQPYKISRVIITNRGDCCWDRLAGASILIGNSPENNGNNNPRCAVISSIQNRGTLYFQCNNMVGQYVNIVIGGKQQHLSLCEVQVFGVPAMG